MKFKQCKRTKTMDTAHDTDIEDSIANLKVAKFKGQSKFKKNKEATIKKKRSIILQKMTELALHSKIMRFRLKYSKKTLRIQCYREKDLQWPIRFTRKIRPIVCDNDNQTDSEVIACEIERGTNNLLQALEDQSKRKCS